MTEYFKTVLSRLEILCEESFVLSRPSFQSATRTCLQTRSHCKLNWTNLFSLQYIDHYWNNLYLSPILFAPPTRQDKRVGGVNRVGDCLLQFSVGLVFNILETKQFCPVPLAVNAFANKSCSHRMSRQTKLQKNWTCLVSTFSVADSLDLSPILFTPPTRCMFIVFVLSCLVSEWNEMNYFGVVMNITDGERLSIYRIKSRWKRHEFVHRCRTSTSGLYRLHVGQRSWVSSIWWNRSSHQVTLPTFTVVASVSF